MHYLEDGALWFLALHCQGRRTGSHSRLLCGVGCKHRWGWAGESLSAFFGKGVMGTQGAQAAQSAVIGSSYPEAGGGGEGRRLRAGRAGSWPGRGWSPVSSLR